MSTKDPKNIDQIIVQLSEVLNCNLATLRKLKAAEKVDHKQKLDKLINIIEEHEQALGGIQKDVENKGEAE